ncbi:MAG: T9SS type A sorting domain-containing protein [Bacteroidota bacterium]
MKNLIIFTLFQFLIINVIAAQEITFSSEIDYPTGSTAQLDIYAAKTTGLGSENMAGFTVNIYYDNTEATITNFDTSPLSTLGWLPLPNSLNFISNSNPTVGITHTGYGTINVIDGFVAGSDITSTPVLVLSVTFDITEGDPLNGGSAFLAQNSNNHPGLQYVGADAVGHDITISGNQVQDLSLGALPIDLTYFRARYIERSNNINLAWQTASEENNDFFTIEKSRDGINFQFLEEISGAGTSVQVLNYSTSDDNPYQGINYYRLKQTDFDGAFEYSEIQTVHVKENNAVNVSIFPNPATEYVTIELKNMLENNTIPNDLQTSIQVFDNNGRLVLQPQLTEGNSTHTFSINQLSNGIYWVRIMDRGELTSERLIIQ